jgi:hypothetical protein
MQTATKILNKRATRTRRVNFRLGQTVATPGALEALGQAGQHPFHFLARHARGDWGDLSPADKRGNDRALRECDRLLSAYKTSTGERLWVITEADRSATTILLPSEY